MNLALLALPVALACGWAALLLELSWLRAASASLPGTLPAAGLVVPAFLVAWAAGSWVGGQFTDRRQGRASSAARWLAWSALAAWLLPLLAGWLRPEHPPSALLGRLAVGALPALPVAFGLGGALPLLARFRSALGMTPSRATGAVAAAVALGGALGAASLVRVLESSLAPSLAGALALAGAALWSWLLSLAGEHGLDGAVIVSGAAAGAGVGIGAGAGAVQTPSRSGSPDAPAPLLAGRGCAARLAAAAFLGGVLLVAGQLALLRVGAQREGASLANTVAVLGWLQLGMAAGAALLIPAWPRLGAESLVSLLLALAGLSLAAFSVWLVDRAELSLPLSALALGLGSGSLVTAAAREECRARTRLGSWVGDLGAVSTLGGVLGGAMFVTLVTRLTDTPGALTLLGRVALGSALVLAVSAWTGARGRRPGVWLAGLVVLAAGGAAGGVPRWEFPWRSSPDELALLERVEGPAGVTSLVATAGGGQRLKLDGRFAMGGSTAAGLARRMGRVAAALAPDADLALVLGLGTGHTLAGVASTSPARVECVERNEALFRMHGLESLVAGQIPGPLPPRRLPVKVIHADARAWVADHPDHYDLIVGDLFFPWISGAGDLLSLEHLALVRRALTEQGVFVQWLPLHQLTWPAFGSAVRAFSEAFPTVRAFVATPLSSQPLVALVGGLSAGLPGVKRLDDMLSAVPDPVGPNRAEELYDLFLTDAWELRQRFLSEPLPTLAHPITELRCLGRQDDEALIARRNTRLLADLVSPLVTTSLERHPIDAHENRELGMALTRHAVVGRQLLLARAALLEREQVNGAEARQRPRLAALDAAIDQALMTAWSEVPGHGATRSALLERGAQLTGEERWRDAAALLHAALERGSDVPLAAMLGGIFTRLGFLDQALTLMRGARAAGGTPDRSLLINLATALLFQGGADAEATGLLRQADDMAPLHGMAAVALGLLTRREGARQLADELIVALDQDEAWSLALRRLRDRSD